ncbi:hypothetical protein AB0L70_40590 [Kribbella sp. NPDC051952]|uniref:hypothetical protein n=1 Tax=Kribbella sp. NPDC051952 TaxID=3154851 RepID=UPI0034120F94
MIALMEPAVQASVIAGCVALAVAIIGVVATGAWQAKATRTANANALAMFERDARTRMRLAHLEDRKSTYVSMFTAVFERRIAKDESRTKHAEREALLSSEPESPKLVPLTAECIELNKRVMALNDRLIAAAQMTQMISPTAVGLAAGNWLEAVLSGHADQKKLEVKYIAAVRADLGVEPEA